MGSAGVSAYHSSTADDRSENYRRQIVRSSYTCQCHRREQSRFLARPVSMPLGRNCHGDLPGHADGSLNGFTLLLLASAFWTSWFCISTV